jgi:hypothetical protein
MLQNPEFLRVLIKIVGLQWRTGFQGTEIRTHVKQLLRIKLRKSLNVLSFMAKNRPKILVFNIFCRHCDQQYPLLKSG